MRRILAGLGVATGAAAVVGTGWAVGWSDLTALGEVRISGADGELADAVVAAVDAPMGTPLVRIDLDELSAAAESLPDVASASAHHSWPTAVTVTVEPREPAAVVADGSSWWFLDVEGVLFGASDERPTDLAEVSVPTGDAPADAAARVAAVAVLRTLPPAVAEQTSEVSAETEASVELLLADGATVMWGTADEADRKGAVLIELLAEDAAAYDVSAPMHPAVRY